MSSRQLTDHRSGMAHNDAPKQAAPGERRPRAAAGGNPSPLASSRPHGGRRPSAGAPSVHHRVEPRKAGPTLRSGFGRHGGPIIRFQRSAPALSRQMRQIDKLFCRLRRSRGFDGGLSRRKVGFLAAAYCQSALVDHAEGRRRHSFRNLLCSPWCGQAGAR